MQIKRILGEILLTEAATEDDQEKATDLIVLRFDAIRIAVRLRRPGYFDRYGDEFTIRTSRPGGMKTELAKILEGFGDYFFYGHAADKSLLGQWGLGKLNSFRSWHHHFLAANGGRIPGRPQNNKDSSSSFRAYRWLDIPGFLIAHSGLKYPAHAGKGMKG